MQDSAYCGPRLGIVGWCLALLLGCATPAQPLQRIDGHVATGAADAGAARVAAPQDPTATQLSPPRLVISEVLADPLLRDEGVGDYVEIVNLARARVPLAELSLLLPNGKRMALMRPIRPWLEPAEVAVAHSIAGPNQLQVKGLRLPNAAGRIELLWRGRPVDAATWLRKRPWPKVKAGMSWERRSPSLDGTSPQAWRAAKGTIDRVEHGSPGQVDWRCEDLRGTALERPCPTPHKARCSS